MWSEGITGRPGVSGGETYHRLGVYVPAESLLLRDRSAALHRFVRSGLLSHITVQVTSLHNTDTEVLISELSFISTLASNPLKAVFFTVTIDRYEDTDIQKLKTLCESRLVGCLFLKYQTSRERTVSCLLSYKSACSACNTHIHLGLQECPADELQWVMEHSSGAVNVINLCIHTAPNLQMRQVDFAHSRLCNMYIYFDGESSDDSRYDYVRKLSEKYDRPPVIVLAKAMIQLGFQVMFSASCETEFLEREALLLCHPFTNRHVLLAPEVPKSFIVADADIQYIIAASEVRESSEDERRMAGLPPGKRQLSFPKIFGEM